MKKLPCFIALLGFLLFSQFSFSQDSPQPYFYIDLPLLDAPFNTSSNYEAFSMEQSIRLSKSFYYSVHYGLEKGGTKWLGKKGKFWSKVIISVVDFAPVPLSNTWLHEEFHRSILALKGYPSKNAHWQNSVTQVTDSDLIEFKKFHNADLIRQATAGNEGNLEFVHTIEKDRFFEGVNVWTYGLPWGNFAVTSFYLYGSTLDSKLLLNYKNGQGTDIGKRDANGFDPINAVYDMYYPEEAYSVRGTHPSGVGIDRYIENRDLSADAQQHLRNQFYLSFLNFANPNLLGFDEFGKKIKWNLTLRHHMTPFGHMVAANVYLKNQKWGMLVTPQLFQNNSENFGGAQLEFRHKYGKLKLAGWQQPRDQSFFETEKQLGGLIGISASLPKNKFRPYLEINAKSSGWVAANPYLDKNISVLVGMNWFPFE